jgi:hypothetical protein
MLMRISLIVAIIAGLAAGAINFIQVKNKIDGVVAERESEKTQKQAAQTELASTKNTLAKTEKELTNTKEQLVASQEERDKAVAEAQTQIKKSTELSEKLSIAISDRDDARAKLAAYESTGFTPPQIAGLGKQIRQAQEALEASLEEKKILSTSLQKAVAEIDWIKGKTPYVKLRADLKGKILVADPKWEFVILNVGEDEGAKINGEMLVSRNGKLVAKVIISEVQKGRCIANVLPGWKLGDVVEGDSVIPAYPES